MSTRRVSFASMFRPRLQGLGLSVVGRIVSTLPTTATLVSNTAATVNVGGVWSSFHILPLSAAVVFARGDGTAVVKADSNYACISNFERCVPVVSADGTTTGVSLISATAGDVQVSRCCCDD